MKVCFDTYGCRLNRAEALEDEARYAAAGHVVVKTHREADIIVLRGCSVTARAQRDCEKEIARIKGKYPGKRLVVTGCLQKSLLTPASLSGIDRSAPAPVPTSTARAYLKVQDGCSSKCTFCTVPRFRGEPKSVDFGTALDRAAAFAEAGYTEIVMTGCNLMQYSSQGKSIADLSAALANVSPRCRIRMGSVEPGEMAKEVVAAMAENERLCRFLHLSVQSGSTRILTLMGRKYRPKDVEELVALATEKMQGIALGADMICGFPGETDFDHIASLRLMTNLPFSNVHAFPYSERPGTRATKLPGAVPPIMRKMRARQLSKLMGDKRAKFAAEMAGRVVEAVVEDEKECAGWTGEHFWIKPVKGDKTKARRRELVRFRVKRAQGDILEGTALDGG